MVYVWIKTIDFRRFEYISIQRAFVYVRSNFEAEWHRIGSDGTVGQIRCEVNEGQDECRMNCWMVK